MTDKTFAQQVWETLSVVDCSADIDKKGNFSYLPWAKAWTILKEHYPESVYHFDEGVVTYEGGTVEVNCQVYVREGDEVLTHSMHRPVMGYNNVPIVDPDCLEISNSKMRCLVKCIALFGLGIFLYRGEDIPKTKKKVVLATKAQQAIIMDYNVAGILSPRRMVWLDHKNNFERMTKGQAQTIIDECKAADNPKEKAA